jgi:hypothetical protein
MLTISVCAASLNVTWKEQFQIAATHDGFDGGSTLAVPFPFHSRQTLTPIAPTEKFTVSTTPQDILFGQSYLLPQDWTDQVPNVDPHAPSDGLFSSTRRPLPRPSSTR